MGDQPFFCPVCHVVANRAGGSFVSEWAVASHVAGCIRVGDKPHEAWAKRYAPEVDLNQSVPLVAEALRRFVRLAMESSQPRSSDETQNPLAVLRRFEIKLHQYVRQRLEEKFGVEREAWWMNGVPLQIRQECARLREAESERGDLYKYTYLIDLKTIMDKNWALFEKDHARLRSAIPDFQKRQFLDLLSRINDVRNRHAHPVRAPSADSQQYAEDLGMAQLLETIVDVLSGAEKLTS
jgi:hypothetical protein